MFLFDHQCNVDSFRSPLLRYSAWKFFNDTCQCREQSPDLHKQFTDPDGQAIQSRAPGQTIRNPGEKTEHAKQKGWTPEIDRFHRRLRAIIFFACRIGLIRWPLVWPPRRNGFVKPCGFSIRAWRRIALARFPLMTRSRRENRNLSPPGQPQCPGKNNERIKLKS